MASLVNAQAQLFPDADAFLPSPVLRMASTTATHSSQLAKLDFSQLKVEYTTNPRPVPAPGSKEVTSHRICTDHMITAGWTAEHGWANPELIPYGALPIMPTASVLHYATACFEGMKLYRGYDGKLRLFRPHYNVSRMLASATRISLPGFEPQALLKLIHKLCAVDGPKWLPRDRGGSSLYIRPTLVGSDPSLGFQVPQEALLFIIISYWETKDVTPRAQLTPKDGMRLLASQEDMVRAWPGGTGSAKISANYGPSLLVHSQARKSGFDQVLWLFGPEGYVTEAGSSNFFVIWRTERGNLQMVTAALDEHTILAGVTRQSILELAKERFSHSSKFGEEFESLEVVETKFTIFDIISAAKDGRLLAAFAVGTACFIVPISHIRYKYEQVDINVNSIPHVSALQKWMCDILYGNEPSAWTDVIQEE